MVVAMGDDRISFQPPWSASFRFRYHFDMLKRAYIKSRSTAGMMKVVPNVPPIIHTVRLVIVIPKEVDTNIVSTGRAGRHVDGSKPNPIIETPQRTRKALKADLKTINMSGNNCMIY